MEILENCDHIKGIVLSPWLVGNRLFCTCVSGNPHLMSGLLEKMKKKTFFFCKLLWFSVSGLLFSEDCHLQMFQERSAE